MESEAFSEHEAREARENRLRRRSERDRARRASETPEEREKRLSRRRERQRAMRASHSAEATETAEQRQQRLSRRRDRERARRASHSAEARDTLLQTRRDRLDSETSEERQARRRALSRSFLRRNLFSLYSLPSFVLRESFTFHFCKLNFMITNNHNYAAMTHTTTCVWCNILKTSLRSPHRCLASH